MARILANLSELSIARLLHLCLRSLPRTGQRQLLSPTPRENMVAALTSLCSRNLSVSKLRRMRGLPPRASNPRMTSTAMLLLQGPSSMQAIFCHGCEGVIYIPRLSDPHDKSRTKTMRTGSSDMGTHVPRQSTPRRARCGCESI